MRSQLGLCSLGEPTPAATIWQSPSQPTSIMQGQVLGCGFRCLGYIKLRLQHRVQYAKEASAMAESKLTTCAHLALRSLWLPTL